MVGEKFDQVLVIELNPFLPTTNDGLFNWARDADILEGRAPAPAAQPLPTEAAATAAAAAATTASSLPAPATAPTPAVAGSTAATPLGLSPGFEFRLRTKVDQGLRALLLPEWRSLISSVQ